MHKMLGSSANPENIALTVKGILIGIIPVIIIVAKGFNVDINNDELTSTVEFIVSIIVQTGALISLVMTAFGAIRKIVYKFKK